MTAYRRVLPSLVMLCGSLLVTGACAATARPGGGSGVQAPAAPSPNVAQAPDRQQCASELRAIEARVARLDRTVTAIRAKLASAGFERTTAEAVGEGTAAPGLTLDAARSAGELENLLADRTSAYAGLNAQIDWIAANWFDPVLMRWTARQIRALASMTAEEFGSLKAETTALRDILPDLTASKRRQQELRDCARTTVTAASDAPDLIASRWRSPSGLAESASEIVCGPNATLRITCQESVVVAAGSAAALLRPLNSSSLTDDELSVLGPDSSDWIAFARSAAGIGPGAERVYVDGMPAITAVPASMIGRITVNGDPFTSEYSNVGETRIDIDPRAPDRRWRVNLSAPSFGAGGGSPLGPTGAPVSRSTTFALSGPVPRLPITFSVHGTGRLDARRPLFAAPHSGALATAEADLQTTTNSSGLVMSTVLVTSRVMARVMFSDTSMQTEHAGIGGINGPTTGQRLDSMNRSFQTTWRIADAGRIHRGGFSFRQDTLGAAADSLAPFTIVTGQHATGGDELAADTRRASAWTLKHVVEMGSGKWKAGFEGARDIVRADSTPNPLGRLQLAATDAVTGTWIVSTGQSTAESRTTSAAIFAEQLTVQTPRATLRSGVRMDWQDGAGVMVSPRVVAAARVSGFQLSGGAGLFVQAWTPDLFVTAAGHNGSEGMTFVLHDVQAGSISGIDPADGDRLRMLIAPGFERRRDVIVRAGLQRNAGPLRAGVEHTWTHGTSLAGAVREREAAGLVDVIGSGRRMRRHQTHLRASMRRKTGTITAHYQHAWSFDDSEGPFALPARAGDVRGEWARSTGVPRHAAGLTASARLPYLIRVSIVAEARSGLPYTILTGRDADGIAAFTDRDGLPRNAGTLPAFRKLSLAASRLVRIPAIAWLAFDVGVRADNLTNQRNVTSVGHVMGSPMFGVPLSAYAGRSIRFWAALAR